MQTIDVSVIPAIEMQDDLWKGGANRYDYSRLPEEMHSQAMLAQGIVVSGLGSAVRRVVEAGKSLSWAKAELPHGEYLPWVQQACGLKPDYAAKLIKVAEWASNVEHVPHFNGVTDIAILFMLSADTTTEEVREWFMERCAAGDPPSRKEVQERKRSSGRSREPQPTEALALSLIRKGEVDRLREALALAEQAEIVDAQRVMAEQRLRELPKTKVIHGIDADFHRMKDGSWVRLPHAGAVDAVDQVVHDSEPAPAPVPTTGPAAWDSAPLLTIEAAARRFGIKKYTLVQLLAPSFAARRNGDPLIRKGFRVTREGRGMVRLTPVP